MIGPEVFEPGFGYNLLLSLHLIGVLLWAGGLLHAAAMAKAETPGLLARSAQSGATLAILSGLMLAFQGGWLARGWWLYAKIFLVLMLIPVTLFLKRASDSAEGDPRAPLADFGFRSGLFLIIGAILVLSVQKF